MSTAFTPRMLVRVSPTALSGRKTPHFVRAIVISVGTRTAEIKPLGRHRRTERVPLAALREWKAKAKASQ
jgi:hypothetical protein